MAYNSQGGFTWGDLYTMPVYLRTFYTRELVKVKEEEKKEMDKANKGGSSRPSIPSVPRR